MTETLKVMIVDDDATTLQVVGAALEQRGHVVIRRETALGTTLAILREKPDVVLLDVGMPGLTGDKLATVIRQDTASSPLVLLYSASPLEDLERLARNSGAAGALAKVADPAAFAQSFEQLVSSLRRAQRRAT